MADLVLIITFGLLAIGLSVQPIIDRDVLFRGRLLALFAWPVLFCFDGHPRIVRILIWAKGEKIIEQSEWPPGVVRQTILCRDGTDYIRALGRVTRPATTSLQGSENKEAGAS